MAFLKALTLFIVCILIFRVIVSEFITVENKKNSTDWNVSLDGRVKCNPCDVDGNEVTIILYEGSHTVNISYADCKKSQFYIKTYLKSPNPEDFTAIFAYVCHSQIQAQKKVPARFINEVYGVYVYTFGTIDLTTTKRRKSRKRRNGLKKYKF